MISKKTRLFLLAFSILCLCVGFYFYNTYDTLPIVYDSTIDNTSFQDVEFERDSSSSSNIPEKSSSGSAVWDSSISSERHAHTLQHKTRITGRSATITATTAKTKNGDTPIDKITDLPVKKIIGRELTAADFHPNYSANARIRLTNFYNTFKNGDYISGKEFSLIYKKDPNLNKIEKSTICSFIEKNIQHISRNKNALVIHTTDDNGIHTKLKIPFVQDLRIDIANGATVEIGQTFSSSEVEFLKTILMPIKLNDIEILHNGEEFPKSGFISGNYYFIDYSKSKMAYKLH
jgi:hypothetical protein